MNKGIEKIMTLAEQLATVRKVINKKEDEHKVFIDELKEQRELISVKLIQEFKKNRLSSIKVQSGETCALAVRKGVEVTSEAHALGWAIENRAVSVNKVLVKQKLEEVMKRGEKLPDGFEYKEVEFISVRSAKPAEGEVKKE